MRRFPCILIFLCISLVCPLSSLGQDDSDNNRKVVTKISPHYPPLARNMRLGGVVKVEAIVAPNGTVKTVAIRGGPPVLTQAATEAVRKWKWAPASRETREPVEVKFDPIN